jgi:hypothetical protein
MPPLHNDPQTVILARESRENIPQGRRVRDVQKRIGYLDPNAAPFVQISTRGGTRTASDPKFEWFEKDLRATWDQVNNGAGYVSGATAIVVDNAEYFAPADIVNVPRTAEKMRVTAVNTGTNTLTVVRGVGTTAAAALVDNDDLQIIGTAYAEGSSKGTPRSHVETNPFNYTQIFRHPFGATETEQQSTSYTGDTRARLTREWGIYHQIDLERASIFGEKALDTSSTDNPRRMTGGLLSFFTSNIKDAGGTLTEPELESWLADVTTHTASGDSRVLFASSNVISVMNQLAAGRLQVTPTTKTFGIAVTQWLTAHGTLNIVKHRLLENGFGGNGYAGWAIAVDPSKITYRPLGNRTTKLITGIEANGDDAWEAEYLTECGWQFENPQVHGVLKNVTA